MAAELNSSGLNPDSHLLLDQPLLKVPYELARKNFKTAQKHVEKCHQDTLSELKATTKQAASNSSSLQDGSADSTLNSLDNMISRMETLKRKLETLHTEEQTNHKHVRARISHVQSLHEIQNLADVKYDKWSQVRLNRLLVDYLLRSGFGESAKALAQETGIEELVDIEAFTQAAKIESSLQLGKTSEALAWCSENKNALKHVKSELEFELRLQQFIELARTRTPIKLAAACAHAKKHLPSENPLSQRAAALLAFPPDTTVAPYAELYSPDRWTYLRQLFLRTHHNLLSLPPHPALRIALSAGLSALKTPACHSVHAASSGNASTATSGNSVCPICSMELNDLARDVPYAHHAKSSVESDPVVLPNGRIFGRERLIALNEKMNGGPASGAAAFAAVLKRNGERHVRWGDGVPGTETGKVRDPMNPSTLYDWSEVRKVYIS